MKKILLLNTFFCCAVFAAMGTLSATADELQTPPALNETQIASVLKERLHPIAEATLQEHCGSECPSFKIEPQFKRTAGGLLEDLGFTRASAPSESPELKSLSLSILISDRISPAARDSLKQIVSHRLSNEVSVPVTVALKPLSAISPALERLKERLNPDPTPDSLRTPPAGNAEFGAPLVLEFLKPLAWPLTLLVLGTLALLSVLAVLSHQKALLKIQSEIDRKQKEFHAELQLKTLRDQNADHTNSAQQQLQANTKASELLQNRALDAEWLIESHAAQQNFGALHQFLAYFPAPAIQVIAATRSLSPHAVQTLAHLSEHIGQDSTQPASTSAQWIESELDRAHWRRLEEEQNPLLKLNHFSDLQLQHTFQSLETPEEQALFFWGLSHARWPGLFSRLNSQQRIQMGILLSQLEQDPLTWKSQQTALVQKVASYGSKTSGQESTRTENLLEDFILYLPEKEAAQLKQELGERATPPSVSDLLQALPPAALLEVCMQVDLSTLQMLLPTLSESARTQIFSQAPKGLRERLSAQNPNVGLKVELPASEAVDTEKSLRARGDFVRAFRKIQQRVS